MCSSDLDGDLADEQRVARCIAVAKSFSVPVFEVGQNSTITFTVSNFTGAAATGIAFSDAYPGGMQNTGGNGGTCVGVTTAVVATSTVTFTAGTLASGASCTITVQVVGIAPGGVFTNTTTGATRTGDAVPGDVATAAYTVVASPTVVKTFSPSTVNQTDITTLSITIANPNTTTTVTRVGAAFLDTYPANLVNANPASVTLNCTAGSTAALTAGTGAAGGNTIGLSNVSIAPGDRKSVV